MSYIFDIKYRTRAIISRGLYIFYPIFHYGLYCRAVYNAERLLFRDSFFIQFTSSDRRKQKTNQRPICSSAYLLHLQPIVV